MIDDEPAHEAAVRFIAAVGEGAIEPVLAEHCRFEVRHALVRAARRGRVAWSDLPQWFDALDALEAMIAPLAEKDEPVLALAQGLQLTWSDAHWVEIAARLDLPLLTADLRLIRSVPDDVAILVDVQDAAA
jgi:predicted nucleic acid-binding protein